MRHLLLNQNVKPTLPGVIFPIMVQRLIVEVGFAWSIRTRTLTTSQPGTC